jgi:hypothetical protein
MAALAVPPRRELPAGDGISQRSLNPCAVVFGGLTEICAMIMAFLAFTRLDT